jgi:metal-dependent amidase/aminoacylase/carboxypeptidase family protein
VTAAETQTRQALKDRVSQIVESHASELEDLARQIFAQPQLGFKEHRTAMRVHEWFDRLSA